MRDLNLFEQLARASASLSIGVAESRVDAHPFNRRNIHPDLPERCQRLFDDGYYAEATFEAFKFVESEVKRISGLKKITGFNLMMKAFDEASPEIELNARATDSETDEQRGFRYLFAGAQAGIRNPRGHEFSVHDTPDVCLDHLAIASTLLRRLDECGVRGGSTE